jgi:hypothetical protein
MKTSLKPAIRYGKRRTITLSAPTGGWNTIDNLDNMPAESAIEMENWIPKENCLELRGGYSKVLDTQAPANTLFAYNVASNEQLLFASGNKIIKANFDGGQNEILKDGCLSDRWQYTLYKNRIFAVNGEDMPFVYNGENLSDVNFHGEGFSPRNLIAVEIYQNRLFFVEKNSLKFWYAESAGNVQGEVKSFDLSQFASKGGHIKAISTWTQGGAAGQDSQLVFITSQGEIFIYSGTSPDSADSWQLKGIFLTARPVGFRCVERLGGDIIVITCEGYFNLSKLLAQNLSNKALAFSARIDGALKLLSDKFEVFGWQIKYHSQGSLLIINVPEFAPRNENAYTQHVMNTVTGAWCKFTGVPAVCFEVFKGKLYFAGVSGNLYVFDNSETDDGKEITGTVAQAYSNFDTTLVKSFKEMEILVSTNSETGFSAKLGIDFLDKDFLYIEPVVETENLWDISFWDDAGWSVQTTRRKKRIILFTAQGYKGSIGLRVQSKTGNIKWFSTVLSFEEGTGSV